MATYNGKAFKNLGSILCILGSIQGLFYVLLHPDLGPISGWLYHSQLTKRQPVLPMCEYDPVLAYNPLVSCNSLMQILKQQY